VFVRRFFKVVDELSWKFGTARYGRKQFRFWVMFPKLGVLYLILISAPMIWAQQKLLKLVDIRSAIWNLQWPLIDLRSHLELLILFMDSAKIIKILAKIVFPHSTPFILLATSAIRWRRYLQISWLCKSCYCHIRQLRMLPNDLESKANETWRQ